MSDQLDLDLLDNQIRTGYPYPLAATYYRAFYGSSDYDEIHEFLLDLFEVTLKYLASVAMSQYLLDGASDPQINKDLLALERPSLGHWQGWLRDILALYRRRRHPLLIPELGDFYLKKHNGEIGSAAGSLRQIMSKRLGSETQAPNTAVTTQQFFELLGEYRNRLAHGARPSRFDRERVAVILLPAMRQLFKGLAFLVDYPLVFVNQVNVEFVPGSAESRFAHRLTFLSGDRPRVAPRPEISHSNPAHARELYLLDKDSGFHPLLSLHPLIIFRHCESCNIEQAFVLNTSREKTLDYLSYQCTHHFNPSEYVEYMSGLLNEIRKVAATAMPAAPGIVVALDRLPLAQPGSGSPVIAGDEPSQLVAEDAAEQEGSNTPLLAAATILPDQDLTLAAENQTSGSPTADGALSAAPVATTAELAAPANSDLEVAPLPHLAVMNATPALVAAPDRVGSGDTGTATPNIKETYAATPGFLAAPQPPTNAAPSLARISAPRKILLPILLLGGIVCLLVLVAAALLLGRVSPATPVITAANAADLQLLRSWQADPISLYSLAFTPDDERIVTSGGTPEVHSWRVIDGSPVFTATGATGSVRNVVISPDGQIIAGAADDGSVRLWQTATGALLQTLRGKNEHILLHVAFAPQQPLLAAVGDEQPVQMWSLSDFTPVSAPNIEGAYNLAFTTDGSSLAVAQYASIQLLPLAGGAPRQFQAADDTLWGLAVDKQGLYLSGGSGDGSLKIWRLADGALITTVAAHSGEIYSLAFSPDGSLLASTGQDGRVRLWSVPSGAPVATLMDKDYDMYTVNFSSSGAMLAAGGQDGSIYLWSLKP